MTPGGLLARAQPRLRNDVVITRHEDARDTPFVVKDPRTTRFFRFREAEHFIVTQLDGETPLEVVRRRAEERFGATLSETALTQFVGTLQAHGLLEAGPARRSLESRSRLKGGVLYLRLRVFDPDRLLARMVTPLGPLFSTGFLVLSLGLVVVAMVTVAANTTEMGRGLLRLLHVQWLLTAWIVVIVVGAVHELAHGLACKRFGGEVHDMGVLFIYFNPAFYCDVSDGWLFPRKWKRVVVTLAGPYLELVVWALAALTWRLTNPDSLPNTLALIVVAATGVKMFFNLNPLLKLDGYYLLSDWLGIPNLRQRSFAYLAGMPRRLGGSAAEETAVSGRERAIYLLYGVLALLYSVAVLWWVSVRLWGELVPRFHAWGLLMFAVLVGARLRNRLRLLPRRSSASPSERQPAARRRLKKGWLALAALAASLIAAALVEIELRVTGEFRVLPTRNAEVRAEVEGLIAKVHVHEGMKVQPGDLVARLSDRDLMAELRKIEAEIAEKRATLRMLRAGPRPEEIAVVEREIATARARVSGSARRFEEARRMRAEKLVRQETTVAKAEERLRYKRSNLERMRHLRATDLISLRDLELAEEDAVIREKELDEARAELQITRADDLADVNKELTVATTALEEARSKLDRVLAGSRHEMIEAQEAEIARLSTQQRYLEEQLRLTAIRSAIAGTVTTPERQLQELIGRHVKKGDLLASVHRLETVTAEIAVSERDVGDVAIGQGVVLKARAYPSTTFQASVTSVAAAVRTGAATSGVHAASAMGPVPEEGGADRVVLVTTEIANSSTMLKPEMTGRAKISCGDQTVLSLLTRRLARVIRVEFWSWW